MTESHPNPGQGYEAEQTGLLFRDSQALILIATKRSAVPYLSDDGHQNYNPSVTSERAGREK